MTSNHRVKQADIARHAATNKNKQAKGPDMLSGTPIALLVFWETSTPSTWRDIRACDWVKRIWRIIGHEYGIECPCGKFAATIPSNGMCGHCKESLVWGKTALREPVAGRFVGDTLRNRLGTTMKTPAQRLKASKAAKQALRELCDATSVFIASFDIIMSATSPVEVRGVRLASVVSRLELANDMARRYGLAQSWPTIKRYKEAAKAHAAKGLERTQPPVAPNDKGKLTVVGDGVGVHPLGYLPLTPEQPQSKQRK